MTRLLSAGLTDGGTAGLIWGFLGVSFGFSLVYASIAEMASMLVRTRNEIDHANVNRAPTAGGQYHWVSEFAPRRGQKFLSYITGNFYLSQCKRHRLTYHRMAFCHGMAVCHCINRLPRWHHHPRINRIESSRI